MTEEHRTDSQQRRAVFLDRDGVLVVPEFRNGRSYAPRTLDTYRFYEGAAQDLTKLHDFGFRLIVVTNQPDIANNLIEPETVATMHNQLGSELPVDEIFVCPHGQKDDCDCRKPKPGMLLAAAEKHKVDLDTSFMVGDRNSDMIAGKAAGCHTIFIDLGYEAEKKPDNPDWIVNNLHEAVTRILENEQTRK